MADQVGFKQITQLSNFDQLFGTDEIQQSELIDYPSQLASIGQAATIKSNNYQHRALLVEGWKSQYEKLGLHEFLPTIENFSRSNTFCITTAHQPILFTGPIYFIYKLFSAIKLADQSNQKFPDKHFIPVFYLGGEDHDLEECNHLYLFQKKITWETSQTGAVGRMSTSDISSAIDQVKEILGENVNSDHIITLIRRCYNGERNIADATTLFLHSILPKHKFLVFNGDFRQYKSIFIPIIKEEIFHHSSEKLVTLQQEKLEKFGIKVQAHVRPINFFYHDGHYRLRIEQKDDHFILVNSDKTFSKKEMESEIENHPEKFSPNVIIRPLYQETILPSVAYIGGGGELAYWVDRKLQFEHYNVPYPVLVRRDSMLIFDPLSIKKLDKLQIPLVDVFKGSEIIKKEYLQLHESNGISLDEEKSELSKIISKIKEKSSQIDPSLSNYAGAETSQFFKIIQNIEQKMKKSSAQKHEIALNQIDNIYAKLFPNQQLQERVSNFMEYYNSQGDELFEKIYHLADPLAFDFKILYS